MEFLPDMAPVRNFNFKVLGWFWVTVLVCLLSIAVPALIVQQFSDGERISEHERHLLSKLAQRVDEVLVASGDNPRQWGKRLRRMDARMPYQWLIVDDSLNVVTSSMPLRASLTERFESRRFWYFIQGGEQRDINLEWTRLIGPVELTSRPDWKLVLWRPERPRALDVFRTMPWWLMLGIFIGVTSLMSWLLVRSVARPLNRLGAAFTAVGNGQLSHRIEFEDKSARDRRYASSAQFSRLFAQFNEMTAKITALIQNQKRQSADISHELRTPLTRLQMTLALVRRKCTDEGLLPLLERAERENELLNLHIQRLSDLTTMEARAIQQGPCTMTATDLLGPLCEDAAFEAQALGMQWQHRLCDVLLTVYEEPFITAIENVVRNAFKYASSAVSLHCYSEGSTVNIAINDDGPGVDDGELHKLTDAFFRTDDARNSETGGLGLGLAIAVEAVRLNRGALNFSRSEKGGLQVLMTFPVAT